MNVGDICTREIILADHSASLQQAATLIEQESAGRQPLPPAAPPQPLHIPAHAFT